METENIQSSNDLSDLTAGGMGHADDKPRSMPTLEAGSSVMGEVASSVGLQAALSAIAQTSDTAFDLTRSLRALAEVAQTYAGANGIAIERARDGSHPESLLTVGQLSGSPRRLPINAEGEEIGYLAIYGAPMFGPATAERTQMVADVAALALARAARIGERTPPFTDEAHYRLISGVGHNLRNTLGAASGYMQLAEMEGPLSPSQREWVVRSRRAINAAVSLISDVLELNRADAGKLSFEREPVNVEAIAREAMRKHMDAADPKHCAIEFNTTAGNPVILSDSSYVQQIVDVLVYNAVRYTPSHGRVSVTVDTRKGRRSSDATDYICVSVTDTGAGVQDAQQVFEEVHRVEQAKGNVRFRLAICRRVARLLGGDMTLDTEKNVGSTFTLWLPAPAAH